MRKIALLVLTIAITLVVLTTLVGVGTWRLMHTDADDVVAVGTGASEEKDRRPFVCGSIKIADLRHAKLSEFSGALAKTEVQATEGVARSRWVLFLPEGLHIPASARPDAVYDLTGSDCLDLGDRSK